MVVCAIIEMIDMQTLLLMILAGVAGMFGGYMLCSLRIYGYLKKYYPDVDFSKRPKERKQELRADESKKEEEKNRKEQEDKKEKKKKDK